MMEEKDRLPLVNTMPREDTILSFKQHQEPRYYTRLLLLAYTAHLPLVQCVNVTYFMRTETLLIHNS